MSFKSQTKRGTIFQTAIQGAMVWAIYAAVECWFLAIMPWLLKPYYDYIPLHWGFTILLSGLYTAIGLMMGGVSAFALYGWSSKNDNSKKPELAIITKSFATFGLIFAFDINLVVQWPFSKVSDILPSFSISLVLIIALALGVWSRVWYERLRFVTNPLTTSLLIFGLPWVTSVLLPDQPRVIKALSLLAYLALVFLVSFFIVRVLRARSLSRSEESKPIPSIRVLFVQASAVLLLLGISFFLRQEPHYGDQNLKPLTQNPGSPNVILITMDTVRADHLPFYGYQRDTTPNLRKVLEEGVLYSHAIAPGDMTLSTHASIFTGLYATRHSAHVYSPPSIGGRPLADKFRTVAEILAEKGYSTLGIVANYGWLSHHFGLDQGFQYYDARSPVPFLGNAPIHSLRWGIRNVFTRFASPSDFDQRSRRAEDINKEVFIHLDKLKERDRPFFLFLNYMDAHNPYIPPAPFDVIYPGKDKTFTLAQYYKILGEVLSLKRQVTEKEYRHLISQYDGAIAYIDFHLGKLIARLKKLGLYENCLLIITSDHGEAFGRRDLFNHGVSVYQDAVHVPLIIKYPKNSPHTVINDTVSLCDLMPTILDIMGYEIPQGIDGRSFLRQNHSDPREVVSESFPDTDHCKWHPRLQRTQRAMFSGTLKFIESTSGKRELYDLLKDPNEKVDLYKMDDDTSRELEAKLNHWLNEAKKGSGSSLPVNKEAIEQLKSLGYVK
jgi:arylsulfatase A-like enzyme